MTFGFGIVQAERAFARADAAIERRASILRGVVRPQPVAGARELPGRLEIRSRRPRVGGACRQGKVFAVAVQLIGITFSEMFRLRDSHETGHDDDGDGDETRARAHAFGDPHAK